MMVIIEDSRQQVGQHTNIYEYCQRHDIKIVRNKLLVGDYSLPTDQSVVVDTKYGLAEVYNNLVQDHERFRNECVLAKDVGIKLVILVEESGINSLNDVQYWKNPRLESYMYIKNAQLHGKMLDKKIPKRSPISSARLMNMMIAMEEKYGIKWEFCNKRCTGAKIMEILNAK